MSTDHQCTYIFKRDAKKAKKGDRCETKVCYGGKLCWQHKKRYDSINLDKDPQTAVTALELQMKAVKSDLKRIKLQAEECQKFIEAMDNPPSNKDSMVKTLTEMQNPKI